MKTLLRSASQRAALLLAVGAVAAPTAWWGVHSATAGSAFTGTAASSAVVTGSGSSGPPGGTGGPPKGGPGGPPGGGSGGGPSAGQTFTISGHVDDLAPTVTKNLVLVIDNPNAQAITVTDLSVKLKSVTKAVNAPPGTCAASTLNLVVGAWNGVRFTVPARSAGSNLDSFIPVTMPASSVDACQGAAFNLSYSGTAVQS